MRRVAAPTTSDGDDREDDLARIVLYFLLSSRVSLQDLECKLYDISMNISPVSQNKKLGSGLAICRNRPVRSGPPHGGAHTTTGAAGRLLVTKLPTAVRE